VNISKQVHSIQWTKGLFMPFLSCRFPYSVLILCVRCGQPVRVQQPHFLLCYQRATYTWAQMNITPSLAHSKHVPLLSYVYCKYHTPAWQGQNFRSHLLLCMFSGTSGNYQRAAWNRAKSHMQLPSRGLVAPALCYRLMVNSMKTSFAQSTVATPLPKHMK